MKKGVLALLAVVLVVLLAGCSRETVTDSDGVQRPYEYGLAELEVISDDASGAYVAYDPRTMVCYLVLHGIKRLAISPYYVVNEWGEPEIAVYGENYFVEGE